MKKLFVLSILMSFAMVCSCQKHDSTAEQQLAQRKTELDAREETLIQRQKAVEEREKAVAEREKALANNRIIQSQRQAPNAAQAEAERQRRIQQLPPELRALISRTPPDTSQDKAEKDRRMRERSAQRQLGPEDLNRQWQRKLGSDKAKMSAAAAFPEAEPPEAGATSPSQSPAEEDTSSSPSSTPK